MSETTTSETLFGKYGGFSTVGDIVHRFYEKILEDDTLEEYFWDVDMVRLIRHQTDFLCMVLGGPAAYTGRSLKDAHQPLKITEKDFFTVAGHLEEALEEGGLEDEDVSTVIGIVAGTKNDIVTAG